MKIKRLLMVSIITLAVCSCGKENAGQQSSTSTSTTVTTTSSSQTTSSMQWIKGWRDASALVGPRAGAATVVVNGYIYVIGGVNGIDFVRLSEYAKINDDGSLSPWQETSLLNEERGFIDAVAKDGYIYVVGGGNGPNGKNLLRTVERARVNEDGSLSAWQTMQSGMVMPRRCSKTVIKGNFVYALGGFAGALLDNVERAEILSNGELGPWTIEEVTMTIPRYVNTVKASHGNTYVIGGHDQMKGVGITDVEWAVPSEQGGVKQWKATSNMQVGRYGLASAGHGNSVYAMGGLTGLEYLNSIEVADIRENGELSPWRYTTPLSEPRATFNVVVYKDWIYVIGGTNQDRYLNTVEYASFDDTNDIGFLGTAQEAQTYQAKLDHLKAAKPRLPNYGTVKAVQHASMYTYVQVVNDQGMLWLAGPKTELQLNDKIWFSKGVSMSNFYSKELQRSFPQVLFVSNIEKE
ncbi:Kelch repeat-containing protein [Kaarinaea lacus]